MRTPVNFRANAVQGHQNDGAIDPTMSVLTYEYYDKLAGSILASTSGPEAARWPSFRGYVTFTEITYEPAVLSAYRACSTNK